MSLFGERYARSRYLVQKTIKDYSEKPALRAYMEIFLTLIAISLFGVFAIRPTVITIGRLVEEIKARESTLNTMNQKIKNLNSAKELYESKKDDIALIENAVPEKPRPDNLALQIEDLANQSGVGLSDFSIQDTYILKEDTSNEDQDLEFKLSVSGDYFSLLKFSNQLEELRRPIKYNGITITSTQSKDETELIMVFKDLSTPYFIK